MGIRIGIGSLKIGQGSTGVDWSSYWATLISATVENAAPTDVVLTFPTAQPSLAATDFTITGFTISSASWSDAVLTLVLSVGVSFYEGNLTVTFGKTGETATVINNIESTGTIAWYDYADLSTITKSEANVISQINDKLASGRNMIPVNTYEEVWSADGIVHNLSRVDIATFAMNQPSVYYLLYKPVVMTNDVRVFSAVNQLVRHTTSGKLLARGGSANSNEVTISLNEWHILKVQFDGDNSWLQVDGGAREAGNWGALFAGAMQFGYSTLWPSIGNNFIWREFICRNIDESEAMEAAITAYLEKKK